MVKLDKKTRQDLSPPRASCISIIAIFIGISSGSLCGGERHKMQSHILIKGKYAVFIKYALINLDEITLSRNILAFLFSFGLTNYLFHRIPVCARKDLLDFPDEMG